MLFRLKNLLQSLCWYSAHFFKWIHFRILGLKSLSGQKTFSSKIIGAAVVAHLQRKWWWLTSCPCLEPCCIRFCLPWPFPKLGTDLSHGCPCSSASYPLEIQVALRKQEPLTKSRELKCTSLLRYNQSCQLDA